MLTIVDLNCIVRFHPNQVLEDQDRKFVHMNKTLLGKVLFNAETVFSLLTYHSRHEYQYLSWEVWADGGKLSIVNRLCYWRAVFKADTNHILLWKIHKERSWTTSDSYGVLFGHDHLQKVDLNIFLDTPSQPYLFHVVIFFTLIKYLSTLRLRDPISWQPCDIPDIR